MRPSPRIRRLNSDYRSICQLRDDSSIFSFECTGSPPQKYELVFHGAGFFRDPKSGKLEVRHRHRVAVEFGAAYPRMMPGLAWKTPIFHPNISNNGVVCLGGYGTHWVPSLTLAEMATMLWEMIRYKNFDSDSPYNREAALWARTQTEYTLPIDSRSIRDRLTGEKNENILTVKAELVAPKKKPSPWSILSRLVSSEPPAPTEPIQTVETIGVRETGASVAPAQDSSIEVLAAESAGIQIVDAQIVEPSLAENVAGKVAGSATGSEIEKLNSDAGIVFLN
jgi:ubiquitin-protein ligase